MATVEELEAKVRRLEQRIRVLEDMEAIRDLKARYARLADARYRRDGVVGEAELRALAEEIAALFTEDAVWDGGGVLGICRGRSEIRERFLAPTLRFSWHYFVKPRIVVEGERAHGSWDLFAPCTSRSGEAHWMAGVEEDEYRRVDGEWLHSRMKLSVVFLAPYGRGWAPGPGSDGPAA